MKKPRTKRKELQRQITLLRRALLSDDYTTDQFWAWKKEALVASGGEHLTMNDWAFRATALPYGVWRLLNQSNDILDDPTKDNPDVKV